MCADCGLTPEQVGRLDRWQAAELYAPRRDDRGNVQGTARSEHVGEREKHRRWWRARCQPAWREKLLWDEHVARVNESARQGGRGRG